MKKQYLLAVAAASLLLATGCQKEQELVTLGAEISQPAKTYIDNRYPCWNEGDEVYVNSAAYPVSAISGSSAQIVDVVGADAYRAIFPASLVTAGSNIETGATIPVTLPATQKYQVVDGHQRVDAPMGAYTDGGTLQFYNLCSIVHVVVNNNTGSDMTLGSLKMETANAMLSGTGTATVNGTSDDGITLTSDASHSVSLRLSGATNVTLAAGAQSAFDIYVPSFATDNVTITLYTTDGYYYELTKSNVALRHNTYTTVTLNVDQLTQILAAELVDGPTFNAAIPNKATAVVFEYNSSVSSGTVLSTNNSPVPIYGNLDGKTWRVSTSASMMNANPNCSKMFYKKSVLRTIDFGSGFNTFNVTDMKLMFNECFGLTNLDVSCFNTENVRNMLGMFGMPPTLSRLVSLDVSCFNTENVTNMQAMFAGSSLINLDLTNFDTRNVTNMYAMFHECYYLTNLRLSHFNTENVTNMSAMFYHCYSLTNLDISHFNTENVTNMSSMFDACNSLTSLDVSNFNTENVTNMHCMFNYCVGLISLDISNFNTENVTNMGGLFSNCRTLTSLDVSRLNTENVTNMSGMFKGCTNLTSLDVSNLNTENATTMEGMFSGCTGLISLDLSNFNTENVVYMMEMFQGCTCLTSLDLSNFNTENVVYMNEMFEECSSLTSLNVSNFNTENVLFMRGMYSECGSLTSLDLSSFNTGSVQRMDDMFAGCCSLTTLNLSHFDMSHVRRKTKMCKNLSSTSRYCSITCPATVQTQLENGTNLPISGVTFTWVRP